MGTRATITVRNNPAKVKLYKHYDGYPDGTLPWLKKFNEQFSTRRGDNPAYKFAQLIRSSATMAAEFGLGDCPETGWGVVPEDSSCGAEYEYVLEPNGEVTYKAV